MAAVTVAAAATPTAGSPAAAATATATFPGLMPAHFASVLSPVPPPDYDWEIDEKGQVPVSCVSLGCSCAVAACLSYLKLRDAAYPFDWNRTTIEGVIHFLRTGFADFLQFFWVQAFPGGQATGGNSYHGAYHSVWHEDMGTADGPSKYHRRIQRFFQNTASRLLFIRILNTHAEVANAKLLLEVLQALFVHSEVFLLLIAVCQPSTKSFIVEGTQGRLLVHCIEVWSHDVLMYKDAILFGHRHASAPDAASCDPSVHFARSCEEMFALLTPFFGGAPQQVPFCPRPLYMPVCFGQDQAMFGQPQCPAQTLVTMAQTTATCPTANGGFGEEARTQLQGATQALAQLQAPLQPWLYASLMEAQAQALQPPPPPPPPPAAASTECVQATKGSLPPGWPQVQQMPLMTMAAGVTMEARHVLVPTVYA